MNNPHAESNQTHPKTNTSDMDDEVDSSELVHPSTNTETYVNDTATQIKREEEAVVHDVDETKTNENVEKTKADENVDKTKTNENEPKADASAAHDAANTATDEATNAPTDEPAKEKADATPTPIKQQVTKSEAVCWICYETLREGSANDPTDTIIRPCKCKGTLGGVHQECLLAWMVQTNATTCPQCHYAYDLVEQYPSTVQRVCDHPWLPTCVSAIICATLFYLFHRIWRRLTQSKTNAHARKSPSMSSARLFSMMGGGMPLPFMMPQMNDIMGSASSSLFQKPSFNLSSIIAEIELFALSVMMLYGVARYAHQYFSPRARNTVSNSSAEDTVTSSDEPTHLQYLNSFSSHLHTFWSLVDDIWAQRSSGSGQLNNDEAFYMMPFDILTTMFYVVEHICKQTQTWAVNKTMVVRTYEPSSNSPELSVD